MRRVSKGLSGVETPLFEGMIADRQPAKEELGAEQVQVHVVVAAAIVEDVAEDVAHMATTSPPPHGISSTPQEPSLPPHQPPCPPQPQDAEVPSFLFQQVLDTCSALARRVEGLENDKAAQQLEIVKLKARGRIIADMDQDEGIELVADQEKDAEVEGRHADKQAEFYNLDQDHSSMVLSMQEDDTEAVAASTPIPAAKPKILNIAAAHAYIKRSHGMKKKPQTESEAHKNIIFYLKNTEGYKMDFFKGMKYDEILPIFQAKFDANMRFLFKSREEMEAEDQEIIKSINETPAQKATKRRKLSEEAQEAKDLRKRLEVVEDEDDVFVEATPLAQKEIIKSINETPAQKAAKRRKLSEEAQEAEDLRKQLEVVEDEDDDVFIEATSLAQKVPVVDYQIVLIDNKPRYKIKRADDTHQLYISFTTLLKNFDKEDLETLWRIVRDRFSTSKPTNFLDEYLFLTLKTMFKEPDGQDAIWRNQKSVHGLALVKRWKLLTSCGVHVITLSTV
nr:hypothetical protein [Tanacetum cinerariifolium]